MSMARDRKASVERVVIQWQTLITEAMRDAIAQAVREAKFSEETFISNLREEFKVESIEQLRREQFLPCCKMIVQMNDYMK